MYSGAGKESDDDSDSEEEGEETDVSSVSSDTDDDVERHEKLQLMVMKTAKGLTIEDLVTPRKAEKKGKAKAATAPTDAEPGGAGSLRFDWRIWDCLQLCLLLCCLGVRVRL